MSNRLVMLAGDIKFAHTAFALPFALLAAFLAAAHAQRPIGWEVLGLIVLCMGLARTVAMTMNRWADRHIDSQNPRTADRALPSGQLDQRIMLYVSIGCGFAFIVVTGGFYFVSDGNLWPLFFSPLVLVLLVGYSFAKRVTWLCHLILGITLAASPIAAAIAVAPSYLTQLPPYLLALMVMCWATGFDIIYALQDTEVDQRTGIYSMPARFGVQRSLWISRLLHLAAVGALVAMCYSSTPLGLGFTIGIIIVAVALLLEHLLILKSNTPKTHATVFTINGIISLAVGALGLFDIWRGA